VVPVSWCPMFEGARFWLSATVRARPYDPDYPLYVEIEHFQGVFCARNVDVFVRNLLRRRPNSFSHTTYLCREA